MYEDVQLLIKFLDQLDAKWLSYKFFKFVGEMVGGPTSSGLYSYLRRWTPEISQSLEAWKNESG